MSDEALLAACGTGDLPALDALFERFYLPLYRFLARLPTTDDLTRDDVVLVTGGGKGIGAETAIHIGRSTGAKLLIAGRGSPDPSVIARFEQLGLDAALAQRQQRGDPADAASRDKNFLVFIRHDS